MLRKKFNVLSYQEYVCPCCGRKKFTELTDIDKKCYCSFKHITTKMKKTIKTEIV